MQDQPYLAILMIPDVAAARALAGLADETRDPDVLAHPAVHAFVRERLAAFAGANPGSSTHVARAIFLDRPPSIDAGEITDKGSLNNAIVREQRRDLVEHLYTSLDHPAVIAIG